MTIDFLKPIQNPIGGTQKNIYICATTTQQ
jgi:hypothetical protein